MKINNVQNFKQNLSKTEFKKENNISKNLNFNYNSSGLNCLANYNLRNISFGLRLPTDSFDLSKIKLNPNFTPMPHHVFMYSRPMAHNNVTTSGFWRTFNSKNGQHSAWKMHLYADNETDLQKLCCLFAPYFRKNDINWKTLDGIYDIETDLNQTFQKGKAITIYPHSNDEFARLAHDISFIIKNNNLQITDSKIIGDRQLGDTGRIFYRYEYKSKNDKDLILDLDSEKEYSKYRQIYESTRLNDKYLAQDMTPSDDIWFNFNPDIDGAKISE